MILEAMLTVLWKRRVEEEVAKQQR